jgi:hypothetical protein
LAAHDGSHLPHHDHDGRRLEASADAIIAPRDRGGGLTWLDVEGTATVVDLVPVSDIRGLSLPFFLIITFLNAGPADRVLPPRHTSSQI